MAYSKVVLYKENSKKEKFIVIYYKHNGPALRFRTGVTVKERDFDKKSSKVKQSDSNFEFKNSLITTNERNIEGLIEDFIKEHGIKPSSQHIKSQLDSGREIRIAKLEANLIDCFDDFLIDKRVQFNSPERSVNSLKDYISTHNALKDYEAVIGTLHPIDITNRVWLNKFNTFLANQRPKVKGHRFLTKKQNDKTRQKRFGVIKNFGGWLVKNGYLKNIDELMNYKVRVVGKDYYTLKLDELKLIQSGKYESSPQQKAIDMFIVACHTGLRFGDISRIKKTRIKKMVDCYVLSLTNEK